MTVQGEGPPPEEKVDPSAMYSGISMADERINQLKTEANAIRFLIISKTRIYFLFAESGEQRTPLVSKKLIPKNKRMRRTGKKKQNGKKMTFTSML